MHAGLCLSNPIASVVGSSQSDEARYDKYVDEDIFVPQLSSPSILSLSLSLKYAFSVVFSVFLL